MSGRKRHTISLDFMREFIAYERGFGHFPSWGWQGHRELIERLVKRGWLRWERSMPTQMNSFRPIMQRRNHLVSTKKGRRAVYMADRHAAPALRRHYAAWRGPDMRWAIWADREDDRKRARLSRRIGNLHGSR